MVSKEFYTCKSLTEYLLNPPRPRPLPRPRNEPLAGAVLWTSCSPVWGRKRSLCSVLGRYFPYCDNINDGTSFLYSVHYAIPPIICIFFSPDYDVMPSTDRSVISVKRTRATLSVQTSAPIQSTWPRWPWNNTNSTLLSLLSVQSIYSVILYIFFKTQPYIYIYTHLGQFSFFLFYFFKAEGTQIGT